MNSTLALALLCVCTTGLAQTVAAPAAPTLPGEPNVKHIVIEDEGSKIEELRVRGQTQRVVVTPKVGTRVPYEIIISPGARDPFEGTRSAQGASGKTVWQLMKF